MISQNMRKQKGNKKETMSIPWDADWNYKETTLDLIIHAIIIWRTWEGNCNNLLKQWIYLDIGLSLVNTIYNSLLVTTIYLLSLESSYMKFVVINYTSYILKIRE